MKNLKEKDIEFLNKAKESATLLGKKYAYLCFYEINKRKDSQQYFKLIEETKELLEQGKLLYDDPYLTEDKAKELIKDMLDNMDVTDDYILFKRVSIGLCSKNDLFLLDSVDSKILMRLFVKLNEKILFDYNVPETSAKEPLIKKYNKVNNAIEIDFLQMFLSLVADYQKNSIDYRVNNYLTMIKYNLARYGSVCEKELLDNHFDVVDDVSLNSKLFSEILKLKEDTFTNLKDTFAIKEASYQIDRVLKSRSDQQDYKSKTILVARDCFLRSALLLLSKEKIIGLRLRTRDFIGNGNPAYKKNFQSVDNSFKAIPFDFKKQKIISLYPDYRIN